MTRPSDIESPDRMREDVRAYFDSKAGDYTEKSDGGLWNTFRNRESRTLMSLLDAQPGEEILDAGSGTGYYTRLIQEAGARPTAMDLSEKMLEGVARDLNVETIAGDLTKINLEPRFDRVLCAGALEFVPDPIAAVANLGAALRPDGPGVLVLMVPSASLAGRLYRRFHRGHGFRVNLFARRDLEALAQAAGEMSIDTVRRVTFNCALRLKRP